MQSTSFSDGIPVFLIKIYNDLRYETFHLGVKVYAPSLSRNRVSKLDIWSHLEEALRFLNLREVDQEVLQEQFEAMRATTIGQNVYSAEIIIQAFDYFCTSHTLYSKLRQDYALPSIRILTRITSKVGKFDEGHFLKNVFQNKTKGKSCRVQSLGKLWTTQVNLQSLC